MDVAADLDKVDIFDQFSAEAGDPSTLKLIEDPTGTLKNLDGTPAIVVEALGSQTEGAAFVQSYNFPAPAPTDSVYTVYYRWMYPTGGNVSHQELATLSGESEILVDGALLKANGPWFHNWSSLGFCYNGGGAWECEPPLGQFLADTWYEYWMVIDPANVTYDWYIRGGDFTEISVVYQDALYANLDTTAPLVAIQQVHYMGQGGLFGPQYYDAMYIDTTGENLVTPAELGSILGDIVPPDPVAPKLVNISTRGRVGAAADDKLVGGFVIEGTENMDVLIQGVGLELDGQGGLTAAQLLADPKLTLFLLDGTFVINDDWQEGDAAALSAAMAASGSFVLADGSKSSAILMNLAPGLYSVVLSGVSQSAGIALVEVYEVPE